VSGKSCPPLRSFPLSEKTVVANFGRFHLQRVIDDSLQNDPFIYVHNLPQLCLNIDRFLNFCFLSFFLGRGNSLLVKIFQPLGISIDLGRLVHALFDLEVALRLLIYRPQVFIGLSSYSLFCLKVCKFLGCKSVVSHGSLDLEYDKRILFRELPEAVAQIEIAPDWCIRRQSLEFELTEKIHVLSQLSADSIAEYHLFQPSKFVISHPRPNKIFFGKIDRDSLSHRAVMGLKKVSVIGTICGRKGFFKILRYAEACPSVKFELLGTWSHSLNPFRQLLPPNVTIKSSLKQREVVEYLDQQWCVCSFSLSDGYGLGIVEAMARGVPVIVSKGAGVQDLILDRANGFYLPDNSDEFANIIKWLENSDNWESVSNNARDTIQNLGYNLLESLKNS
jgi:glycosyltransferase involved in cell wall biosynthesis